MRARRHRFYFPEDPHTEFNQRDDVNAFHQFMWEQLSGVLSQAQKVGIIAAF